MRVYRPGLAAGEGGIFGGSQLWTDFKCGISKGWGGAIRGLLRIGVRGWLRVMQESGGAGLIDYSGMGI